MLKNKSYFLLKKGKAICFTFLILSTTFASFSFANTNNPYNLTTEPNFEQTYEKKIVPFWKNNGKTGNFKTKDGLTIAYIKFEIKNPKGAIVISNGRTESYLKYQELVYDLSKNGYSVYIHDHRGQGLSQRILKGDPYKGHIERFDDYVDDLKLFIEKVVLIKKHKKRLLLAHSMGGGIATRYIQKFPNIFDGVALSSPMHYPDARILLSAKLGCFWFELTQNYLKDYYAGFIAKPYTPVVFEKNDLTHSKVRYNHLLKIYEENKKIQMGGPTRNWAAQACIVASRMKEHINKITIPVLVLQSGNDTAVTPDGQIEFCKELKKQTKNSCIGGKPIKIEEAYHELFIEADIYRIPALTKILDFFENI